MEWHMKNKIIYFKIDCWRSGKEEVSNKKAIISQGNNSLKIGWIVYIVFVIKNHGMDNGVSSN